MAIGGLVCVCLLAQSLWLVLPFGWYTIFQSGRLLLELAFISIGISEGFSVLRGDRR